MKLLLPCIFLLVGCCGIQKNILKSSAIKSVEGDSITADTKLFINMMLGDHEDMIIPDLIPESILPNSQIYNVNVRIVIEGQPVFVSQDNSTIEGMWWARNPEHVKRDLKNAEIIYKQVAVKFHISEFIFREAEPNLIDIFLDSNKYPNKMTIVYMLPNSLTWSGYSSAPWEKYNRGIVIQYWADEWTVAHEIGHYFGLLHPFENNGDQIDDTPKQKNVFCLAEENATPNCHNIMNYCNHTPKIITLQQVDRFRRFLRAKRIGHCVGDYTDIMLRNYLFPDPISDNSKNFFPPSR